MRTSRAVSVLVGAFALAVFAVAFWLMRTSPEAEAERERAAVLRDGPGVAAAPPAVSVDSWVAQPVEARLAVEVAGTLAPLREVSLGAEVAGQVVEVAVEEHTTVEAGALILSLDQSLPGAALSQALANRSVAEATLRQARSELRRQEDLAGRGIVSAVELERVETDADRAAAELARAKAQVLDAQTRLEKTKIVAPFAAVVASLDLEPGAYLSPGQPVAQLLDISQLEIEVGVGDREVGSLRAGQEASVRVDVFPNETFRGRVHQVGRAPDRQTKRYPVPVRLTDPSGRLLPGMLATVRFEIGEPGQTLRIPRRALQSEFDLQYVFEIVAKPGSADAGQLLRHRVETRRVPFRPDLLEVVAGIEGGERLAITGVADLRDGMEVRFRDRELPL